MSFRDYSVLYWNKPINLFGSFDSCLSCCKSCDRHAERRAGYVVKTDAVAEFNGCGVTTVFAADTNVEVGIYGLTKGDSHLHELTNANLVELSEGVIFKDLGVIVSVEELTSVVTGIILL